MIKALALIGSMALLLGGCAPDITETDFFSRHPEDTVPVSDEVVLLDHQNGAVSIRLISEGGLRAGLNDILIESSGGATRIQLSAILDTGLHRIESPVPTEEIENGQSVFVLPPEGVDGDWLIQLTYTTPDGQWAVHAPVSIRESQWVQRLADSDNYISWMTPIIPSSGIETMEFALHHFTGEAFQPVENAQMDLYPYMDMGGGEGHSAPYVAPVSSGNGRYRGNVNFIMSGGWDLTVQVDVPAIGNKSVLFKGFTVR
jgi:hypothetical protein